MSTGDMPGPRSLGGYPGGGYIGDRYTKGREYTRDGWRWGIPGKYNLVYPPPSVLTSMMATEAGGTHPSGMLSCVK